MVIVVTVLPPVPLMKGAPQPPPMVQGYDLWDRYWHGRLPLMNPKLLYGSYSEFAPGWAFDVRWQERDRLFFTADNANPFMGLEGLRLDVVLSGFYVKPVLASPGILGGGGWYYNRYFDRRAEIAVYPLQWSVGYIPQKIPVSVIRRY